MWRAALFPLVIPQAIWVAARASRLPEPPGPRTGQVGQGPVLRLLILGDSSAAGVGVADQSDALSGQLSGALARAHTVQWQLCARSGATVAEAPALLDGVGRFDAALACFGVNDVKNGVRRARWRAGYAALLDRLSMDHGVARTIVSGLPPVAQFPILPRPLRDVLGARAEIFDADLRRLALTKGAIHLPLAFTQDVSAMASDGFHPGPLVYAEWARLAAAALRTA